MKDEKEGEDEKKGRREGEKKGKTRKGRYIF